MKKIVINGMFFCMKTTGVQRFAKELIKEFDKLINFHEFAVIVPEYIKVLPEFQNLEVIKYGTRKGVLWEQIDLPKYLKKNHKISVNLCNTQPIFCPGIICIHDTAYKTHPEFFKTLFGKLSVLWHRLNFLLIKFNHYPVITVSYFSKYSIVDTYKIEPYRIWVIGNGWQHMNQITEAKNTLKKYSLKEKNFYFVLGNLNYNKNARWVMTYAQKHPKDIFIFSGNKVKNSKIEIPDIPNIRWLGYLQDNEIKALYKNCKAFIFPSIHEGFGIPPMEAMSQGAPVIIANTTCLPEIYGASAHYIDPYDCNVDLEELLKEKTDAREKVLCRYGWDKSANSLLQCLRKQ